MRSFSEKWIAGDARVRGEMVRDLIASKRLDGKTRSQVETLLGPPTYDATNRTSYVVDIGYRWGSRAWNYSLCISFDEARESVQYVDLKD
jgi:hypothetical protein